MASLVVSETVHDVPWSNMITANAAHKPDDHRSRSSVSSGSRAPSSRSTDAARPSPSTSSRSNNAQSQRRTPVVASAPANPQQPSTAVPHIEEPPRETAPPPSPHPGPSDTQAQPGVHGPRIQSSSATPGSSAPQSPASRASGSATDSPGPKIRIRDLQHIQSFVSDGSDLSTAASGGASNSVPQYEISDMPVSDVIEMVAGLLTKITATNDQHSQHLHQNVPPGDMAAGLSSHNHSVLAFHGKNIPTITIMSYLTRIHKYCPATYEVFLSLLVYFDRITERVNAGQSLRQEMGHSDHSRPETSSSDAADVGVSNTTAVQASTRPTSSRSAAQHTRQVSAQSASGLPSPPLSDSDPYSLSQFFVVDSYNIHRLVIAGVTCASKFFSDVFYTNSRYAKVGGLPLQELNHLELQFLVLNDFRLQIPVEELEAYATMLVEFYAREVVAQRHDEVMQDIVP